MMKEGRESDISVLGADLLVEIFCRLGSVKYATQCKSVCKLWCSLINNGSLWLNRWYQMNHKELESVTFITRHGLGIEPPTVAVDIEFLPSFKPYVVGSHKDLLLCYSADRCYYICNPFTKQCTPLPLPPSQKLYCEGLQVKGEFVVGESADGGLEFTVVRIIRFPDDLPSFLSFPEGRVQVCIFSSDRGWREVDGGGGGWREMFPSLKKILSYRGSLVCFIEDRKEELPEVRLYNRDLDSNYTRLPPIPPVYLDDTVMFTIGVCEGRLRMAQLCDQKLIVWQFDDSQRHDWDMLQELDLDFTPMLMEDSTTTKCDQVLQMAFLPHDGDILYMRASYKEPTIWPLSHLSPLSHLFMYDLKRRRLELMRKLPGYISKGFKLFPIVKNCCWPTPVPCFEP